MQNDYLDYIAHHGIAGQKWGQRNGPPYPLEPSNYSYQERKLAKANANKNRYEKKSERANAKGDKLYRKAEKLIAKSNVNKLKGAAPIRTKISDAKLDKSIRQGAQALRLLQKNDDLKIKSLKYSDKAKEFAEEAKFREKQLSDSNEMKNKLVNEINKLVDKLNPDEIVSYAFPTVLDALEAADYYNENNDPTLDSTSYAIDLCLNAYFDKVKDSYFPGEGSDFKDFKKDAMKTADEDYETWYMSKTSGLSKSDSNDRTLQLTFDNNNLDMKLEGKQAMSKISEARVAYEKVQEAERNMVEVAKKANDSNDPDFLKAYGRFENLRVEFNEKYSKYGMWIYDD